MQHERALVAGFLRVEEAEMLSELLASQGIESWVEGAIAGPLGPALRGAGGGARLLVPGVDAERARELIATSGVFRGDDGAPVEIPEQEWSSPSTPAPDAPGRPAGAGHTTFFLYPFFVVAFVALATALCLVVAR